MPSPRRMGTGKHARYIESAAHKALAHPLRAELLSLLIEDRHSPVELSDMLGEPLGNISYHVKSLRDAGLIELVDTQPRRGAIEHFYRARPDRTIGVSLSLSAQRAQEFFDDLRSLIGRYVKDGGQGARGDVIVVAHAPADRGQMS